MGSASSDPVRVEGVASDQQPAVVGLSQSDPGLAAASGELRYDTGGVGHVQRSSLDSKAVSAGEGAQRKASPTLPRQAPVPVSHEGGSNTGAAASGAGAAASSAGGGVKRSVGAGSAAEHDDAPPRPSRFTWDRDDVIATRMAAVDVVLSCLRKAAKQGCVSLAALTSLVPEKIMHKGLSDAPSDVRFVLETVGPDRYAEFTDDEWAEG